MSSSFPYSWPGSAAALAGAPLSLPETGALEFLRREIPRRSMKGAAWDCFIAALADCEQHAWDNAPLVERMMFLATAAGQWLDRRAAGLGVERPAGVGMEDEPFREYAIQLSSSQQTINAILEMLNVFYGDEGTRAFTTSGAEPIGAFVAGDYVTYRFDGKNEVTVTLVATDFANMAAATASEGSALLNRHFREAGVSAFAVTYTDPSTGNRHVRVYSGTLGARSSVEVVASSFSTLGLFRLVDQPGAAYLLTRSEGEVEVFLPAITKVVSRTLADATYLSADYPIPGPPPPVGVGPYLYDGEDAGVSITETSTTVATSALAAGSQYRLVTVASSASFPDIAGWVVFGYGYSYQTEPVRYLGRSGATGILIDPAFTFPVTVPVGARVNLLRDDQPPPWFATGAFALTDVSSGRVACGEAVDDISAAGYRVTKTVVYPGDYGLAYAGYLKSGAQALSDVVAVYAGSDVDAEMATARSA